MSERVFIRLLLNPCKACLEIWLFDEQPHSDDNGQWQRTLSALKCKVSNPTHRGIENWKMCAVKQINIYGEYREMVPEASAGLSDTHGIQSIGLSPGPWFNINMSSCQHRKSHCGDKTVARSSYHHNGISYTGKMTSLYWTTPRFLTTPPPLVFRYHSPVFCTDLNFYDLTWLCGFWREMTSIFLYQRVKLGYICRASPYV